MAEPVAGDEEDGSPGCVQDNHQVVVGAVDSTAMNRKEKRKAAKKEKRKQKRKELAAKEREEEEARLNDPEEQWRIQLEEERERDRLERERREFEERERQFLEALMAKKKAEEEEEERRKALEEESKHNQVEHENKLKEDEDWEYVEEGPPEIIWQGNEIIVKKKRVRVRKKDVEQQTREQDQDRPTSNPLPPQSEAFADYNNASVVSAQQLLDNVAQQIPNFGTEQDKAHCPFHIKTGACRFGSRCSRVHFYPDKSCTLLIKNMYNGPGLAWEQDEGLEKLISRFTSMELPDFGFGWVGDIKNSYTDEEVERSYEEFYEDVHTEFLKFGEIINFKVCKNGSFHLRGNVYVHYKSLDSAVLACNSINGRYFAGKQVKCEYVSLTRWKVAICGEYMKSRLKMCSHGTACNFIHCFRNPGGDYEWADWDKPPPKYWVKKMSALFGYSDEIGHDKQMDQGSLGPSRNSSKMITADTDRYHSRRSRSREINYLNSISSKSLYEEDDTRKITHRHRHKSDGRKQIKISYENNHVEDLSSRNNQYQKKSYDTDSDGDGRKREKHQGGPRESSRHQVKESEFSDYHGHRKSRNCESGSDGEWSERDGDRRTHCGHTRKSSKHRKQVSEILDDHGYSKKQGCGTDSSGDHFGKDRDGCTRKSSRHKKRVSVILDDHGHKEKRTRGSDSSGVGLDRDRDGDGDRQYSHRMKSSVRENKVHESPDDHLDGNRTHDGDSSEDLFDRDRHRIRSRKVSMHSNEAADDHGDIEKRSNENFHRREPDLTKCGSSSREASDGDFVDEDLKIDGDHETSSSGRYGQRTGSHGLGSRYNFDGNIDAGSHQESGYDFPKKHKNLEFRSDEIYESDSPDRYNGRNKSHDSGHYPE